MLALRECKYRSAELKNQNKVNILKIPINKAQIPRFRVLLNPVSNMASPFISLVKKDLLMEWRQKHTLFGVLLYVGATVFVVRMMSGQPEASTWNALFWLTMLFVAVNSVAKSFLQEHPHRFRYYHTLVKPVTFLLAKMLYSILLMAVMSLVSLLLYYILLGWPLAQGGLFVALSLIGGLSLSAVFTFLSAIAARAQQNSALMAILGFPLVTPVLMILSKLAVKAIAPFYMPGWWGLALILIALDVLVILLGVILFPFLWQE
ncbi:MAG: cytochrome biosis protein [Flavipsychrobacter sp.]|jgi:heme exporter protein B|nr:cytochrome biosis protein [Flavipsychrobacter sp.]